MSRERREYVFNTVQTAEGLDYVPAPTRDKERLAMFTGRQGVVIPWLQKVGVTTAERTFNHIADAGSDSDIEEAASLLAVTGMGSAYHTYAQHFGDEVMFRRAKLPIMIDPETDERLSPENLIEKAKIDLSRTAELASVVEEMVFKDRSPNMIARKDIQLGRALATSAVTLAVIKHNVANMRMDRVEMQEAAMQAAHTEYEAALDLTDALGVRPTMAQFADERSPLMQHYANNPRVLSQAVYSTLVGEAEVAGQEALRRDG